MRNCGNCANYNHERLCHTDVCGKCFIEGANGKCGTPSKWKSKSLTNGDRMRTTPDEELAKIMSGGCCGGENGYCIENEYGEANCIDCWLTWLKQPVEGASNG